MKSSFVSSALLSSFLFIASLSAQAGTHPELGEVNWLRDYDTAIAQAEAEQKPVLLLFQEVPGCQGCVNYGQDTLSHPLIVDAIEASFVPLAIFNNQGGKDREILKRFNEPSYNFQVMRFIDTDGRDIIPRKDRVWTAGGTASRMIEALEASEQAIPDYLRTVAWTDRTSDLKTAVFSMHCFWDGEAKLGGIKGVVETEAGWLDGQEVVQLRYDSEQVEWSELVKQAQSHGCAKRIYTADTQHLSQTSGKHGTQVDLFVEDDFRRARASDQKRHLQFSQLKHLPLNPVQRTKINAALSQGDRSMIARWLSPQQRIAK